jgi:hypothetical protein
MSQAILLWNVILRANDYHAEQKHDNQHELNKTSRLLNFTIISANRHSVNQRIFLPIPF